MAKSSAKLSEYRRKRAAERTNEPAGAEPTLSGNATGVGRFVVHLHDATRRHYDLRLEVGGVLESFAVPRGPSLDPADRRLAVRTEPHPIEYLEFEAVIPDGNYGAGSMIVWDSGVVRFLERSAEEGLDAGKVDFELAGYKLRGRFALVLTQQADKAGKQQWLLLKKTDAHARVPSTLVDDAPHSVLSGLTVDELDHVGEVRKSLEAKAAALGAPRGEWDVAKMKPMLCTNDGASLAAPGWIYELKLDGVRIIADRRGDDVALWSRNGASVTARYPEIARVVRALPPTRLVLDGEIVTFDERGAPSFHRLAKRMHLTRPDEVHAMAREIPVSLLVFDLLAIGPYDLRSLSLVDRKGLLKQVVRGRGAVRALDHIESAGAPLLDLCRQQRLEGIVAKRAASTYRPGPRRTGEWVKIKCDREDDFVVVGFTRGSGARDRLGAIDVATFDGARLVVRGKVGSGLDEADIDALLARLAPLSVEKCAAEGELEPAPRGRTFVAPEVVVNVRYLGWTDEGRLRFPVFRGTRDDVTIESCRAAPVRFPSDAAHDSSSAVDRSAKEAGGGSGATRTVAKADGASTATGVLTASADGSGSARSSASPTERRIQVSRRNKVFWPEEGITKGQLCDFYVEIADALLPYLRDRPVVLVRYPDGIAGKHFYQWNAPSHIPSWVRTLDILHEDKTVSAFVVADRDTLLYIANLGAIPLHVIAARAPHLDECDFLTVDFDIERATLADGITLARSLHELLDAIGLASFAKTSGQSGLHVLVPLGPGVSFAVAKMLVELLGRVLESRHPQIATMQRRIADRGARVYVDTGQTGRSRTIVSPYSVRAQRGATVSTPLDWDEVGPGLDPRRFDIFTVPERVRTRGDPMRRLLETAADVRRAIDELGKLVQAKPSPSGSGSA